MGKKFVSMLGEQSGRMTAMGLLVTVMFTMVLAGALSSTANAATMSVVSDELSVSMPSSASNHTISFTVPNAIPAGGSISIDFTSFTIGSVDYTDIDVTDDGVEVTLNGATPSGANWGAAFSGNILTFKLGSAGVAADSDMVVEIGLNATAGVAGDQRLVNPGTVDSYEITITSKNSAGTTIDEGSTWVAIVDGVHLTADVDSYFDFVITAVTANTTIDTLAYETDTTVTTCAFGTLTAGTELTCAQNLNARTNAASGFVVTVEQDHDMLASSGADIDAFVDGAPSAGATWVAPTGTNGDEDTYGHLGFYSSDNGAASIASAQFFGLTGTTQKTVFSHPSPVTGGTTGFGSGTDVDGANMATMLYRVEISDLQEPGHYASRLMYIGTATF